MLAGAGGDTAVQIGPDGVLVVDTMFAPLGSFKSFTFNGETIEMYHQPNAHSDGDSIIYFRGSNVISAGDTFAVSRYPSYDTDGGGTLKGMIDGLNRIVAMARPDTKIIPGHGRIASRADAVAYRDMALDIRNRIQDLVNKGMTLEQVKAAKPTAKYDSQYGDSDNALGDIYGDLTKKK